MANFTRKDVEERFWSKVIPTGFCWEWQGPFIKGYGGFSVAGELPGNQYRRTVYAHRWAYEALVGPIPEGAQLDHLCRVKHCVNPDHLEPVEPGENMRRGYAPAAVLHRSGFCKAGHPRTLENEYLRPDGRGRICRACHRESARRAYLRRKALGVA